MYIKCMDIEVCNSLQFTLTSSTGARFLCMQVISGLQYFHASV